MPPDIGGAFSGVVLGWCRPADDGIDIDALVGPDAGDGEAAASMPRRNPGLSLGIHGGCRACRPRQTNPISSASVGTFRSWVKARGGNRQEGRA